MVQVFSEISFFNGLTQVLVRGRHQSNVDGDLLITADRPDFPFLQGAQELDLHFVSQVSDFVEEDSSALCRYEGADFIVDGSGERTFYMTEEFRSSQIFGNSAAIDSHKRSVGPITLLVNPAGNIFFAGSARSCDQYRHIRRCNQPDMLIHRDGCLAYSFYIRVRNSISGSSLCAFAG